MDATRWARMARVLVVNAGSSSLKLRILEPDDAVVSRYDGRPAAADLDEVLGGFVASGPKPDVAGHRVVHGGALFSDPVLVTAAVASELRGLADLAPLHQPPALAGISALRRIAPDLPSVACFDTAFHATLTPAAATYAVPLEWRQRWDVRRYGFHGLSHAYASRRMAEIVGVPSDRLRVVTAHLGAGASLAAVSGGCSVDTTMGFTPLDGLVMATRPGAVDPGLLLHVQRHGELSAAEVEHALEHEAGLYGLAGTGDMREILRGVEAGDERCRLAFDVYVHRLAGQVAAMAASMGGLDALAFTGGVGERAPAIRAAVCERLAFLGVELDVGLNAALEVEGVVSAPASTVEVAVVAAREDLEIARQTRQVLRSAQQ